MVPSSALILTVLLQIKNPFNSKTAQGPAQCSFWLQEFQAPVHYRQCSHQTSFLSKQVQCPMKAALCDSTALSPAQPLRQRHYPAH